MLRARCSAVPEMRTAPKPESCMMEPLVNVEEMMRCVLEIFPPRALRYAVRPRATPAS